MACKTLICKSWNICSGGSYKTGATGETHPCMFQSSEHAHRCMLTGTTEGNLFSGTETALLAFCVYGTRAKT